MEQHDIAKNTKGRAYVIDEILDQRKDANGSLEFHVNGTVTTRQRGNLGATHRENVLPVCCS